MGLLTGTSWDISNKLADISALWAHGSTSLDVNKATGMLTSNARRISCDKVTCLGTNKCCSNRSHLPECFIKAPHFLLARVQLSTYFPISPSCRHLAASPSRFLCAAPCSQEILFQQAGTSHSNTQGSSTFSWEAIFATPPPIFLVVTLHTLLWKMRVEKCRFILSVHIVGSCLMQAPCGRLAADITAHTKT